MAPKPGRQGKKRTRGPDKRKRNGVPLSRLIDVRRQVIDRTLPDEKTYKSRNGAAAFARAQLAKNGARYQVFNVGTKRRPEFAAVKLDVPSDDVKRSSEFQRLMRVLKHERNRNANGPLARALVELGLRDEGATWPVGDTND